MSGRCFVDTNVLVYAHDLAAGEKRVIASTLVASLWDQRTGVVSIQVLQELYVTLRFKVAHRLDPSEALALVENYTSWKLVLNDADSVREASGLEARYGISFWDALIVQAAAAAECRTLYTEDLNHEQLYGAVRATNPFLEPA